MCEIVFGAKRAYIQDWFSRFTILITIARYCMVIQASALTHRSDGVWEVGWVEDFVKLSLE